MTEDQEVLTRNAAILSLVLPSRRNRLLHAHVHGEASSIFHQWPHMHEVQPVKKLNFFFKGMLQIRDEYFRHLYLPLIKFEPPKTKEITMFF